MNNFRVLDQNEPFKESFIGSLIVTSPSKNGSRVLSSCCLGSQCKSVIPLKSDFMVASRDETIAWKLVRILNFARRYVWATDPYVGCEKTHFSVFSCLSEGFRYYWLQIRILHAQIFILTADKSPGVKSLLTILRKHVFLITSSLILAS